MRPAQKNCLRVLRWNCLSLDCGCCNGPSCPACPWKYGCVNWLSLSPKATTTMGMGIASASGRGVARSHGARGSANHSGLPCAHCTPMCALYTALAIACAAPPHGPVSPPCCGDTGPKLHRTAVLCGLSYGLFDLNVGSPETNWFAKQKIYAKSCLNLSLGCQRDSQSEWSSYCSISRVPHSNPTPYGPVWLGTPPWPRLLPWHDSTCPGSIAMEDICITSSTPSKF